MAMFGSSYYSSFERTFRILARRQLVNYVMRCYVRGGRREEARRAARQSAPTYIPGLEERIAARVAREKARGTYDGPGSPNYHEGSATNWYPRTPKPAAVRPNGGLRGGAAGRWRRS